MSKFANVRAEAAYVIAGHGFADEESGTVEEVDGWNALVTVSAQVLMNLAETDLFKRFSAEHEGATMFVWIREDSQGFVHVFDIVWDTNSESLKRIEGRWNAWQEALDDLQRMIPREAYRLSLNEALRD